MVLIDNYPRSGGMQFAMAWRDPQQQGLPSEVYYYDKGEYWPMKLDYVGYVSELIRFMGVARWQVIFCEGVNFADSRWSHFFPKLKHDLEQMQRFFPGEHWQAAIDRLVPLAKASAERIRHQKYNFDLSTKGLTASELATQTLLDEDFCALAIACMAQDGIFQNDADFEARMMSKRAESWPADRLAGAQHLHFRASIHEFLNLVQLGTLKYTLVKPPRRLP